MLLFYLIYLILVIIILITTKIIYEVYLIFTYLISTGLHDCRNGLVRLGRLSFFICFITVFSLLFLWICRLWIVTRMRVMLRGLLGSVCKLGLCCLVSTCRKKRMLVLVLCITGTSLYRNRTSFQFASIIACMCILLLLFHLQISSCCISEDNLLPNITKYVFKYNLKATCMNFYLHFYCDAVAKHILGGSTVPNLI